MISVYECTLEGHARHAGDLLDSSVLPQPVYSYRYRYIHINRYRYIDIDT